MKQKNIIIGITTGKRTIDLNFLSKQEITYISNAVIDLFKPYRQIIPIFLSFDTNPDNVEQICSILDGLVLNSGEDISPSFYQSPDMIKYDDKIIGIGQPYHRSKILEPNLKRDKFELDLYHAAKKKNIPILGICRGLQLINVAEGGTLHQETPETEIAHFIEKDGWINHHNIQIDPNSKIFSILNTTTSIVSSIHHQSICQLAPNIRASAKADDGTIEIIEHANEDFIIGIQGHIEKILNNFPIYKKLIEAFIQTASRTANICQNFQKY